MRTTGIFTIYSYEIPLGKRADITLIPFGDVHRSAKHCAIDIWHKFLDDARKVNNAYFLGMGDYDDLASTSERPILSHSALHESTRHTIEEMQQKHIDRFAKEISFMKGRLIGLIEGNHYASFLDGTTSTQRLCAMMGCKYLGVSAFVRLCFAMNGKERRKIDIWAHHGLGASRLLGGSLNKVQQMAEAAEADIFLMGHDHKKSIAFYNKLRLSEGGGKIALNNRKVLLARTGSFLKGYVPEEASYIADMAATPTDLGAIKIIISGKAYKKDGKEYGHLDIGASL